MKKDLQDRINELIESQGYKSLGKDPYKNWRQNICRDVGNAWLTIGYADTVRDALEIVERDQRDLDYYNQD